MRKERKKLRRKKERKKERKKKSERKERKTEKKRKRREEKMATTKETQTNAQCSNKTLAPKENPLEKKRKVLQILNQNSLPKSELRRLEKPLIERKRRARINSSIEELRTILDCSNRIEKAEVKKKIF